MRVESWLAPDDVNQWRVVSARRGLRQPQSQASLPLIKPADVQSQGTAIGHWEQKRVLVVVMIKAHDYRICGRVLWARWCASISRWARSPSSN